MKVSLNNEREFKDYVVGTIVPKLKPKKTSGLLVFLKGELGAGKTTITKYIAEALGARGSVVSPTFILERDYKLGTEAAFTTLIHIDAYRFEEEKEAAILQLEKRLSDPQVLALVEWPEKMGNFVPTPHVVIEIGHAGGEARTIAIHES